MKLFVVILHYLVPLENILAIRPEHVTFLEKHYTDGTFIVSGPQEPRTGGIIMAQAVSREKLLEILAQDPFAQNKAAEYSVYEFKPTLHSADAQVFKKFVG